MTEIKEKKVDEIRKEAELKDCPVDKALYYINGFLEGPMCGRCLPCSLGSYEARVRLTRITEGRGTDDDIKTVKKIASIMSEASMCKKGKDTAQFILEWLKSGVYEEHIEGRCRAHTCKALIEYKIKPALCTMCDRCREVCMDNAIIGEKAKGFKSGYLPYEIRQRRCTKCGECIKVCPTEAVILVDIKPAVEVKV